MLAAAAWVLCAWASAQYINPQDDGSRTRTIIGLDPHVDYCITHVAAGGADDVTLDQCNQGLASGRVPPDGVLSVRLHRGVLYMRRSQPNEALADFDYILARERQHAAAMFNRGTALMALGRQGDAVAAFTQSLSFGVMEPHMAYYNRGAAREALGDLRGAMEDYATALEIQPDWGQDNAELARYARTRRQQLAAYLASREEMP